MTQQKTSKGALARREPLGIASIFPTDSNLEHIESHGKIKIFRRRFGVSEPTASLFIELSGFDSPGNLSPRMLFGARFDASCLGIAFPRAIRCQLALIVRFALDNQRSAPADQSRTPRSLALLECNEFKRVEVGRLSPRTDANSSYGKRA